jgi:ABC-2 type transport system permease protein
MTTEDGIANTGARGAARASSNGFGIGFGNSFGNPFAGLIPVMLKEFIHIRRDRATFFFVLVIPAIQLLTFGYGVNGNVRNVPTVVYDAARTQESRRLLDRFANSGDFLLVAEVMSDEALNREIVAGRAQAGIKIPPDYTRQIIAGETATVLILVDGSDAMVSSEASNVANAIAIRESADRLLEKLSVADGKVKLPVEARRKLLFNPDSRSPNFLLPGLIVLLMQMQTVTMAALAIIREREKGTLEQLFMTPVAPLGLLIGKMVPYFAVAFAVLAFTLGLTVWVFAVPVAGSLPLLLLLSIPFIFAILGIGMLVSLRAHSPAEAIQLSIGVILPSIYLSGYIFPIHTMPAFFQWVSQIIPATWMIQVMRGVILRGAGFEELSRNALAMLVMSVALIGVSALRFRKKIG